MSSNLTNPFNPGLQFYVELIEKRLPFTFIRYGDGEWSAIMRDRGRTSSRSQDLTPTTLTQMMKKSIYRCPNVGNYFPALRGTSFRAGVQGWLETNQPPYIQWHDCTVFYKASKKGRLYPLIKAVRALGWPIVVVGPERLRKLDGRAFDIAHFVQIPNKNCWTQRKRILAECLQATGPALYSFSAGPATKPLAWQLYGKRGKSSFIIDLGSLWDPYVGKASRTYHKGMLKRPGVIKRNLEGDDGRNTH